jgi:DNA-binding LacI/PurR family transcriptional regulator
MPRIPADPTPTRPTTRDIAKRVGVSSATVSMALRNNSGISKKTRKLVQRVAKEMGYLPDPEVMKLMRHLRQRHKPRFQSVLCALTTVPENQERPYLKTILESAEQSAEALGYGFMVWRIDDAANLRRRPDLQRILESRGVEGLLLAPLLHPRPMRNLLDWSRFSVVAATNGVLAPVVNRVVPHQFNNMLMICEQLVQHGYRRIGIVLSESHDITTHHTFSAAVSWQNVIGGTEFIRPLVYPEDRLEESLKRWFVKEKPDVIIDPDDRSGWQFAQILGLTIPGEIGFANAHLSGPTVIAGVDERPREIANTAIKLLSSMIQHGEKGIPSLPSVTMIEGEWISGPSIRAKAAKPRRPKIPAT